MESNNAGKESEMARLRIISLLLVVIVGIRLSGTGRRWWWSDVNCCSADGWWCSRKLQYQGSHPWSCAANATTSRSCHITAISISTNLNPPALRPTNTQVFTAAMWPGTFVEMSLPGRHKFNGALHKTWRLRNADHAWHSLWGRFLWWRADERACGWKPTGVASPGCWYHSA